MVKSRRGSSLVLLPSSFTRWERTVTKGEWNESCEEERVFRTMVIALEPLIIQAPRSPLYTSRPWDTSFHEKRRRGSGNPLVDPEGRAGSPPGCGLLVMISWVTLVFHFFFVFYFFIFYYSESHSLFSNVSLFLNIYDLRVLLPLFYIQ